MARRLLKARRLLENRIFPDYSIMLILPFRIDQSSRPKNEEDRRVRWTLLASGKAVSVDEYTSLRLWHALIILFNFPVT